MEPGKDLKVERLHSIETKKAQLIAECINWSDEHPNEAREVEFEIVEATETSLNFKANENLFQFILPGDDAAMSSETVIAMSLDNHIPDSFVMGLNEKLERVPLGPLMLGRVLDIFFKAFICFQGKRGSGQTTLLQSGSSKADAIDLDSLETKPTGNSVHDAIDLDSESENDRECEEFYPDSDDGTGPVDEDGDDDDDGHFTAEDFENEDVELSLEKFQARHDRKRAGEVSASRGYLHETVIGFIENCNMARRHPNDPAKPWFRGWLATSSMNDILQYCTVSTVPDLSWVRLQIDVIGVVSDVNLASALGLSLESRIEIFLEFDRYFWGESNLRRPLMPNRVQVKLAASGPKVDSPISNDREEPMTELELEYLEECKKYPGRQKTFGYGVDVLVPELIDTFFKYRNGDRPKQIRSEPWMNEGLDKALLHYTGVENPLTGLVCLLGTQLRALPSWCAICWSLLPASVWRLRTCENDLCLYEFEELGLGANIHQEIRESPEVVDLELSLASEAAVVSRDVFEPFPAFFLSTRDQERGRAGWFSKVQMSNADPTAPTATTITPSQLRPTSNKKLSLLLQTLQSIPSIEELQECPDEHSLKRKLSKAAFEFRKNPPKDRQYTVESSEIWLSYDLMRFILSTNRLSLRVLKGTEELNFNKLVSYKNQFVVLHDSPEKEAVFEGNRKKRGSFFAFHGSKPTNWYSILRNGLRSMSNTRYMSAGAAYGRGIYLAGNFSLSYNYARSSGPCTWKNGKLKNGVVVVAICEVINGSADGCDQGPKSLISDFHGIYVVPPGKETDVSVRFLIVMDAGSPCPGAAMISGSILHGRGLLNSNLSSVDLRKHYERLKASDDMERTQRLKNHRAEAMRRVNTECQIDAEKLRRGSSSPELGVLGNSSSSVTLMDPAGSQSGLLLHTSKRLKENDTEATKVTAQVPAISRDSRKALTIISVSDTITKEPRNQVVTTPTATQGIIKEHRSLTSDIRKAKQEVSFSRAAREASFLANITVDIPNETNIYVWHVLLNQNLFRSDANLYQDLQELAALKQEQEGSVLLEVSFSGMYPFQPPFVRVVRPRFVFHTGHVTIGGSICMELLTDSGWLPSFAFESVLVQIVNAFIEGQGRVDKMALGREYSLREARDAFTRVAVQHGWQASSSGIR